MSPAAAGTKPQVLLPEPDRLWIVYAPRRWPAAPPAEVRWLDLAAGRLGRPGDGGSVELPEGAFDDVLYLPPVAPGLRVERDRAAAEAAARGTPVLAQLLAGEPPPEAPGVVAIYDLLEPLLAGHLEALAALPPGAAALWPLVAGLTDSEGLRDEGVRRLADAGVAVLQAVSPDLPPEDRRRLFEARAEGGRAGAEGEDEEVDQDQGQDLFAGLFHAPPPDPRPLARAAHAAGMAPFLPRPLPRPPLHGAAERESAGLLALAGELHLRLGGVAPSQGLFRAARFLDRTHYDLRALAREGNLPVLHWLDDEARHIVQEWAATGRSATVGDLLAEYTAPPRRRVPAEPPWGS